MGEVATHRFHIMMVDDDADDALLFTYAMESLPDSFSFSLQPDGTNLINILSTEPPNIIFLDLNMPNKNGYECLKEIRSDSKFDHIPVIIYSTSANKNEIDQCFRNGATNYVVKPFSIAAISNMIRELCNHSLDKQEQRKPFVLKFE